MSDKNFPFLSTDGVGLGDDVLVLFVGGQVLDLVGDAALGDLTVRGLDQNRTG